MTSLFEVFKEKRGLSTCQSRWVTTADLRLKSLNKKRRLLAELFLIQAVFVSRKFKAEFMVSKINDLSLQ